ncbi:MULTISPECIES: helix-turn-helix domain-containing protein [Flavobacterium]|uniref:helix-turn-helix domain-containing protein n=1 Tax=Flavobacterium TaxID=237 RepID=UPI001FCB24F1|nr:MULTISPECIES: AraC family transcriptional regulator [Flavobacterium]UOK41261.1 AraC family transcriptional regulator [Flavobacterium enshiense]
MKKVVNEISTHNLDDLDFCVITRIENANPNYFVNIHRHNFFEILWFTNVVDHSSHFLDFNNYEIENGEILLITPNQVHQMDLDGKQGYALAISKEYFHSMVPRAHEFTYSHDFYRAIVSSNKGLFLQLMLLIENEYNGKRKQDLLFHYIAALLINLEGLFEISSVDSSMQEMISSIMLLVEQKFKEEKKVEYYANQLNISPRKLNSILSQHSGKNLKQYIVDRVILEAKRIILTEELLVKELAYELGFLEPAHFINFFKQQTSFTPNHFKQLYLKNKA